MGNAQRKKRSCPLKEGAFITSAECGVIRAQAACPSSCSFMQRSLEDLQKQEWYTKASEYVMDADACMNHVSELDEPLGLATFLLHDAVFTETDITDEELLDGLHWLYTKYRNGGGPLDVGAAQAPDWARYLYRELENWREDSTDPLSTETYVPNALHWREIFAWFLFSAYDSKASWGPRYSHVESLRRDRVVDREHPRKALQQNRDTA